MLLYGIEIALHAFLRMALLEFGDQRRDELALKLRSISRMSAASCCMSCRCCRRYGAKLFTI